MDPMASLKTYWSLLKKLLNNKRLLISKAFDKIWHEGLIYELKQNGVKGNLLDTLTIIFQMIGNKE